MGKHLMGVNKMTRNKQIPKVHNRPVNSRIQSHSKNQGSRVKGSSISSIHELMHIECNVVPQNSQTRQIGCINSAFILNGKKIMCSNNFKIWVNFAHKTKNSIITHFYLPSPHLICTMSSLYKYIRKIEKRDRNDMGL